MHLTCDRTGFPLVRFPELGLEAMLLPCAKKQFEAFLAEPDERFGDAWYEAVLAVNPRASWRHPPAEGAERLFLTGILPEEALAFLRWLGDGFDLPTIAEWRAIDLGLGRQPLDADGLERGLAGCCPAARALVTHVQARRPRTWGDLALLRGGLVEWVRDGREFGGMGSPPAPLLPNIFNPQMPGDVVRPFPGRRVRFLGFRAVRRP
jgi:hypothetical protein